MEGEEGGWRRTERWIAAPSAAWEEGGGGCGRVERRDSSCGSVGVDWRELWRAVHNGRRSRVEWGRACVGRLRDAREREPPIHQDMYRDNVNDGEERFDGGNALRRR